MLKDLVKKARSYRRFDNSYVISDEVIFDLVDTARLTPSAANRQQLKYIVSNTSNQNELIYPHLNWAGYLLDWNGPEPEQRPSAYIILYTDADLTPLVSFDAGIIGQTIQLTATSMELGACMIASFDKNKLKKVLNLSPEQEIVLVIALGKPDETIVLTDVKEDGCIKYYRDEKSVHYVPKRKIEDIYKKF